MTEKRTTGGKPPVDKPISADLGPYEAFARATNEIATPKKSADGQTGNQVYKYAPLDVILPLVKPVLTKHGLALLQAVVPIARPDAPFEGSYSVTSIIRHWPSDVEVNASHIIVPPQRDAKELGKWITYARRYTLLAVATLFPENEDEEPDSGGGPITQPTPRNRGASTNQAENGRRRRQAPAGEPPPAPPWPSSVENPGARNEPVAAKNDEPPPEPEDQEPEPDQGAGPDDEPETQTTTGVIEKITTKAGKTGTRTGIKIGVDWYSTFSTTDAGIAQEIYRAKTEDGEPMQATVTWRQADGFRNLRSIAPF